MKRLGVLMFGLGSYAVFLMVFLYAVGFIGNFVVPTSLDGEAHGAPLTALAVNTLLLGVFALQHSVMARPWFKRWWTQFVPTPLERSVYVMATNLALVLMFVFWQPMGGVIWNVQSVGGRTVLYTLYALGWLTVLATTCLINHFDLFGIRQVWLYYRQRPYVPLGFVTPGPYRIVRHPLYVGWLTVFWSTPTMTLAHLIFALGTTAYILIAIYFEERDLVTFHGKDYVNYRRRVPMLIPVRLSQAPNDASMQQA